LKIVMR
jgi:uncharacterized membrane protein YcaP (DUF421 family)